MVTDSKHAKVAVVALLIIFVFAAAFLMFFNKSVIAQDDGGEVICNFCEVDNDCSAGDNFCTRDPCYCDGRGCCRDLCDVNSVTNKCEGNCPYVTDLCVPTKYGPYGGILECGCKEDCDQATPPNCTDAVCMSAGSADPKSKCVEGTDGVCFCQSRDCEEIEDASSCSAAHCPPPADYCKDHRLCVYPIGTTANCDVPENGIGCYCLPSAPCNLQPCKIGVCGAECVYDHDCKDMPGTGVYSCDGQKIMMTFGYCDDANCSCTLLKQLIVTCGGTAEDDICANLSHSGDCDACDVTGDQDGDQDGWQDAVADQCDPDCSSYFDDLGKTHIASNSPSVDSSNYELSPELTCDGIDNDCNGIIDDIGGGKSVNATGCRCYDGTTSPGTWREACDAIDDDCDGAVDEDFDADGDGYFNKSGGCEKIHKIFDCDDDDPDINPNATELCLGEIDEDCDGDPHNGCNVTQDVVEEILVQPVCGDGKCDDTESAITCCIDCGVCPEETICGDGVCESGETAENCPEDCRSYTAIYAGIGILMLVVVIILLWWFFFRKPKQDLSNLTVAHGIETPSAAATPDVGSYISNCLSLGYSPDQIKGALITKGWDENTVNSELSTSHGNLTALGELAEKHKVDVPHDDVGKVEKYVADGLKQGFSATEIKAKLISVGWSEDVVDDALSKQPKLTKELDKLIGKHKISKPPKNEKNIPKFVKESLNKGHTTKQVKKTLEDTGWTPDIIGEHLPNV